ncbi:MAG: DEAD/DEAH box helicase family protein [Burkholderiaceae bacterium]
MDSQPQTLEIIKRAHPDLGRLGVVWHTQGSGKSYSMAFFTEKVRRTIEGNFTFVLMTDRDDLDSQIYKTFVGCGVADDRTPRASSGKTWSNCSSRTTDLLQRGDLSKVERERIKQASRELLAGVLAVIAPLDRWIEKEQTQAEVQTFILDQVYNELPEPPYTPADKQEVAALVYRHIWQQSASNLL